MAGNEKKASKGMDWLGILSFGFFVLLLGAMWVATPNLSEEVKTFFNPENWRLQNVTENITFPRPERHYPVLYTAAMQFCIIFGAFQIAILALRFFLHEPLDRIEETLGGIVLWFSFSFFLNLLTNEAISWFSFLAGIIVSVGLSIIVRGIVKFFKKG